ADVVAAAGEDDAVVLAALSFHFCVGGLAPDFSHDTMWYHLSVPGQWVITGRCLAMPLVFPSNYPLALEAVYAGLLTFSNEIFAAALNIPILLFLMGAVLAGADRYCPRGALPAVAALFIPALARQFALVPLGMKHDRLASLALLLAFLSAWELIVLRRGKFRLLEGVSLGFILTTALATKVLTIAYIGPFLIIFALQHILRRRSLKRLCLLVALIAAVGLAVYSPWIARSMQYSGDPFFPYGATVLRTDPQFDVAYQAIGIENTMYEIGTPTDIVVMLGGFRRTIYRGLFNADVILGLMLLTITATLAFGKKRWRWQGVLLLWFFWVPLLIRGHTNVLRYFGVCYPLGVLGIGWSLHLLFRHMSHRARIFCLLLFLLASCAHYAGKQWQKANYETFQWPWHPMVTRQGWETMATHAEKGSPLAFRHIRDHIEKEATVLFPSGYYPYYLKRQTIWADEVVHKLDPVQALPWHRSNTAKLKKYLREKEIDYILLDEKDSKCLAPAAPELDEEHVIERAPLSQPSVSRQWYLYRVLPVR
ncbi:MAG: hypothetical protein ACOC2L_01575, partial [Candidatus Sumerlaeota bacterium]